MDIYERIFNCGVITVIKIEDENDAVPLAKALTVGGLDVLEVTFRTDAAAESIRNMVQACPDTVVGAGTVSNIDTVKRAVSAGAKFIVSPGFNPVVVDYCVNNGIPVIPGVSSATDIEAALSFGLKTLKFFPAETSGGLKTLKALSAPYNGINFMPTGGISPQNLASYLAFDKVIACGGSWIAKEELIEEKNFSEIKRLAKEAVNISHGFEFSHVSINPDSNNSAEKIADAFSRIFGFSQREISVSFFASDFVEIMKVREAFEGGHIAIKTINIKRAIAYLERNGIALDYETIKMKNGMPSFIYLKDLFGSFRLHLVQ